MEPISFELNGFPKTLRNEAACEKAIAKKSLTPDTPVLAYDADGTRQRILAKDHPVLSRLFGIEEDDPEPNVEEAPEIESLDEDGKQADGGAASGPPQRTGPKDAVPAGRPEPDSAPPAPSPIAEPEKNPGNAGTRDTQPIGGQSEGDAASSGEEPVVHEPAISPVKDKPWLVPAIIIGGITFVGVIFGMDDEGSTGPAYESAPEDTAAASAEVDQSATYYVASPLNVRSQPSPSGFFRAELGRNTPVTGVRASANSDWLEITQGPYAGGFVSAKYLVAEPRPTLSTSTADDYFTVKASSVYAEPTTSSYKLSDLPFATKVTVAGSISEEFAEVIIGDLSRPVGYVPWDAFGGEGGSGERRWLSIRNLCRDFKNIALSLVVDGERKNYDTYLTYAPNTSEALTYRNGSRVYVNDTELYWADLGPDFHRQSRRQVRGRGVDQTVVNGQVREMKRIVPRAGDDGEYIISFCD